MSTGNTTPYIPPRYTINVEALQRVSSLGVIDPETGERRVWVPSDAINFLSEMLAKPGFSRDRYCNRCTAYDEEMGVLPHQLRLPWEGRRVRRRTPIKIDPVGLPWQSRKPPEDVHVTEYQKSRPGMPLHINACHMCLFSFLDEPDPIEVSTEQAAALKLAFRVARREVRRLYLSKARQLKVEESSVLQKALLAYTERLLDAARQRMFRAANACRAAGIEPDRPRANRLGDPPPEGVGDTEWVRPVVSSDTDIYDHFSKNSILAANPDKS